jgi:hypothetical protein
MTCTKKEGIDILMIRTKKTLAIFSVLLVSLGRIFNLNLFRVTKDINYRIRFRTVFKNINVSFFIVTLTCLKPRDLMFHGGMGCEAVSTGKQPPPKLNESGS